MEELKIFVIQEAIVEIGGGRTTDDMVETADKLVSYNRPFFVSSDITQEHMSSGDGPLRKSIIEFFSFGRNPTTEQIRACCQYPGYTYASYEEGLRFQEQYPNDQRESPYIFMPEYPWIDTTGNPRGALFLWTDSGKRRIDLLFSMANNKWMPSNRYARRKIPEVSL